MLADAAERVNRLVRERDEEFWNSVKAVDTTAVDLIAGILPLVED